MALIHPLRHSPAAQICNKQGAKHLCLSSLQGWSPSLHNNEVPVPDRDQTYHASTSSSSHSRYNKRIRSSSSSSGNSHNAPSNNSNVEWQSLRTQLWRQQGNHSITTLVNMLQQLVKPAARPPAWASPQQQQGFEQFVLQLLELSAQQATTLDPEDVTQVLWVVAKLLGDCFTGTSSSSSGGPVGGAGSTSAYSSSSSSARKNMDPGSGQQNRSSISSDGGSIFRSKVQAAALTIVSAAASSSGQLFLSTPRQLSLSLWALAKLQCPPPKPYWLAFFAGSHEQLLVGFSSQDLANTLWALAAQQVQPPKPWLDAALVAVLEQLPSAQPQGIGSTLLSLASLGVQLDGVWVESLVSQLQPRLQELNGRTLVSIFGALVQLGVVDVVGEGWLECYGAAVGEILEELNSKDVVQLCWALGVAAGEGLELPMGLLVGLTGRVRQLLGGGWGWRGGRGTGGVVAGGGLGGMSPGDVCLVMWAMVRMYQGLEGELQQQEGLEKQQQQQQQQEEEDQQPQATRHGQQQQQQQPWESRQQQQAEMVTEQHQQQQQLWRPCHELLLLCSSVIQPHLQQLSGRDLAQLTWALATSQVQQQDWRQLRRPQGQQQQGLLLDVQEKRQDGRGQQQQQWYAQQQEREKKQEADEGQSSGQQVGWRQLQQQAKQQQQQQQYMSQQSQSQQQQQEMRRGGGGSVVPHPLVHPTGPFLQGVLGSLRQQLQAGAMDPQAASVTLAACVNLQLQPSWQFMLQLYEACCPQQDQQQQQWEGSHGEQQQQVEAQQQQQQQGWGEQQQQWRRDGGLLQHSNPQDLATLAWVLAQWRQRPLRPFLVSFLAATEELLPAAGPDQLAPIAWALAQPCWGLTAEQLEELNPGWGRAFLGRVAEGGLEGWGWGQLNAVVFAGRVLGLEEEGEGELLERLCEKARGQVEGRSWLQLQIMLLSIARFLQRQQQQQWKEGQQRREGQQQLQQQRERQQQLREGKQQQLQQGQQQQERAHAAVGQLVVSVLHGLMSSAGAAAVPELCHVVLASASIVHQQAATASCKYSVQQQQQPQQQQDEGKRMHGTCKQAALSSLVSLLQRLLEATSAALASSLSPTSRGQQQQQAQQQGYDLKQLTLLLVASGGSAAAADTAQGKVSRAAVVKLRAAVADCQGQVLLQAEGRLTTAGLGEIAAFLGAAGHWGVTPGRRCMAAAMAGLSRHLQQLEKELLEKEQEHQQQQQQLQMQQHGVGSLQAFPGHQVQQQLQKQWQQLQHQQQQQLQQQGLQQHGVGPLQALPAGHEVQQQMQQQWQRHGMGPLQALPEHQVQQQQVQQLQLLQRQQALLSVRLASGGVAHVQPLSGAAANVDGGKLQQPGSDAACHSSYIPAAASANGSTGVFVSGVGSGRGRVGNGHCGAGVSVLRTTEAAAAAAAAGVSSDSSSRTGSSSSSSSDGGSWVGHGAGLSGTLMNGTSSTVSNSYSMSRLKRPTHLKPDGESRQSEVPAAPSVAAGARRGDNAGSSAFQHQQEGGMGLLTGRSSAATSAFLVPAAAAGSGKAHGTAAAAAAAGFRGTTTALGSRAAAGSARALLMGPSLPAEAASHLAVCLGGLAQLGYRPPRKLLQAMLQLLLPSLLLLPAHQLVAVAAAVGMLQLRVLLPLGFAGAVHLAFRQQLQKCKEPRALVVLAKGLVGLARGFLCKQATKHGVKWQQQRGRHRAAGVLGFPALRLLAAELCWAVPKVWDSCSQQQRVKVLLCVVKLSHWASAADLRRCVWELRAAGFRSGEWLPRRQWELLLWLKECASRKQQTHKKVWGVSSQRQQRRVKLRLQQRYRQQQRVLACALGEPAGGIVNGRVNGVRWNGQGMDLSAGSSLAHHRGGAVFVGI